MKKRKYFWLLFCFLSFFHSTLFAQERKNPFLVEWNDAIQKVKPGETYTLKISFHVPDGHYLYYDKTEVKLTRLGNLQEVRREIPKPEKHFDSFLKQETDAYLHDFEIKIFLKAPSNAPLGRTDVEGEIKYQGCSSDFCYRPMKQLLIIPFDITLNKAESQKTTNLSESQTRPSTPSIPFAKKQSPAPKALSFWEKIERGQIDEILQGNFTIILLLAFLGGLLTCFTPCVIPIVPLTLAVVGIKKNRSFFHNFMLSLSLVLGMSLTYSALGLFSAVLGFKLGFIFQSQVFLVFLILFFILMALSLWGFFEINLPQGARNFFANLGGDGFRGAFLAGLSIGFIASPCVGPLLGPLLLWVAKNQKLAEGAVILFVYGCGMGSLFVLMGSFYSTLAGKIKGGHYTNYIKKFLAFTMLLPAIYYAYVIYQQHHVSSEHRGWNHSLKEGFEKASQEHKAVLVDFYADWCLPCLEIDKKTFHDPRVEKELQSIIPIKINCTLETPECKEAVNKYEVVGWPTLYFLNSKLELQKDLSVVGGFVGPERMLEILSELKNRD